MFGLEKVQCKIELFNFFSKEYEKQNIVVSKAQISDIVDKLEECMEKLSKKYNVPEDLLLNFLCINLKEGLSVEAALYYAEKVSKLLSDNPDLINNLINNQ